ncbi:MAG: mannose-6-phosphate isomerase, class I [Sediminibacterium sp.]|jgi:mannose-6-phosphate isomerase|nr:mannose-6-phosphate isomerase, class I [Sediminibacterium sp.]
MQTAYKLHGVHRHYDWGGTQYIPQLMQLKNDQNKPFAEYWMGAHASAPAIIDTDQFGSIALDQLLQKDKSLGNLPYLYKILDVASMLSIQVHPNKSDAAIGFEKEEKAGISLTASNRNYKDKNHKPEVMVALSDFWLLHGFLAPALMQKRLNEFQPFKGLVNAFANDDYKNLYQHFMQLDTADSDAILIPLLEEAVASVKNGSVDKMHPHWWANKYYQGVVPSAHVDKGIFSIYILNIVFIPKNHGIFQGAGLLHAYLEGQNIELMANSDNVLRGGLTPKHVDMNELMQHVLFKPTYPAVMEGTPINPTELNYPCPVSDFGLSKLAIKAGESYTIHTQSIEMLLVMEGQMELQGQIYQAGEVALIKPEQAISIGSSKGVLIFRSFAP